VTRTELSPGATARATLVVEEAHLASAFVLESDERFPRVFATARMVSLMELAAARLLVPLLGPGEMSVGVSVEVRHLAPTPPGVRVEAEAEFVEMDGSLYLFKVEARDPGGIVGRGTHRRAIVDAARLEARAAQKVSPVGP
jgi:predicted thioesterase